MRFWLIVFVLIFTFYLSSAYELGISPSDMALDGRAGEKICRDFAVFSKDYNGKVVIADRWSFIKSQNAENYNLSSKEIGLEINYKRSVDLSDERLESEVCFKFNYGGNFYGILLFRTEEGDVEIVVPIYASITGNKMPENNSNVTDKNVSLKEKNDYFEGKLFLTGSAIGARSIGATEISLLATLLLLVIFIALLRALKRKARKKARKELLS